jgi:hypothetical protein
MFISTTTAIEDSGTWDSGAKGVDRIDTLAGYVNTDQAGTLKVEQTFDGENWDVSESFSVVANTTKTFTVTLIASQVRITFENTGGSDQGHIRLYARGTSAGDS